MDVDVLTDFLVKNGAIKKKTAIYYLKHIQMIYSEGNTNLLTGLYEPLYITNYTKMIEIIQTLQHKRQWDPASVLNYYNSMVKICRVFREFYGELHVQRFDKALEEYNKIYIPMKFESDEKRKDNTRTEKQSENWKEWSDILKDRDAQYEIIKDFTIENQKPSEYMEVLRYVLCCLYTIIPPRRSLDYQYMKIAETIDDCTDKESNYFVRDQRTFVFNVYKMAKEQQIVKVPKSLCRVIEWYVQYFHPFYKGKDVIESNTHYLFLNHLGKKLDCACIVYALNCVFKKKISINMLRHIYITCNLGESLLKAKEAAKIMSHSSALQFEYIKN